MRESETIRIFIQYYSLLIYTGTSKKKIENREKG